METPAALLRWTARKQSVASPARSPGRIDMKATTISAHPPSSADHNGFPIATIPRRGRVPVRGEVNLVWIQRRRQGDTA